MARTDVTGLNDWDSVRNLNVVLQLIYLIHISTTCSRFPQASSVGSLYYTGKHAGFPLAFRCIKGNGGVVPSTLVGVTRIYPVLYKERWHIVHIIHISATGYLTGLSHYPGLVMGDSLWGLRGWKPKPCYYITKGNASFCWCKLIMGCYLIEDKQLESVKIPGKSLSTIHTVW